MSSKPRPPASVTNFGLNLVGVFGAIAAFYILRNMNMSGPQAVFIVCFAGVIPIVLLDVLILRVHRRETTGIDWDTPHKPDIRRVATKLLGLAATVAPFALGCYVFPEYGDWYGTFWNVLRRFGVGLVAIAIAYTWIVDGHMREPRDA